MKYDDEEEYDMQEGKKRKSRRKTRINKTRDAQSGDHGYLGCPQL